MTDSAALPRPQRKSVWVAIALQCIPLLGGADLLVHRWTTYGRLEDWAVLTWSSFLFWGFGYKYLGHRGRWTLTVLIGPVFVLFSYVVSFIGVTICFEGCSGMGSYQSASFQEALLITGAVVILSVDAWRLAMLHNAALEPNGRPRPETSA